MLKERKMELVRIIQRRFSYPALQIACDLCNLRILRACERFNLIAAFTARWSMSFPRRRSLGCAPQWLKLVLTCIGDIHYYIYHRTNLVSKRDWALGLTRRQTYDTHTACGPRKLNWACCWPAQIPGALKFSWGRSEICSIILLLLGLEPSKDDNFFLPCRIPLVSLSYPPSLLFDFSVVIPPHPLPIHSVTSKHFLHPCSSIPVFFYIFISLLLFVHISLPFYLFILSLWITVFHRPVW
jgi:hypothetical protein